MKVSFCVAFVCLLTLLGTARIADAQGCFFSNLTRRDEPVITNSFEGATIVSLDVMDLDADGWVDVVAVYPDTIIITMGSANGTFGTPTTVNTVNATLMSNTAVAFGRLRGLAVIDIVVTRTTVSDYGMSGQTVILYGPSYTTSAFIYANTTTNNVLYANTKGVAVADMNGDGKLDIVLISSGPFNANNSLTIFTNGSSQYYTASTTSIANCKPSKLRVADLDGDDDIDILFACDGPNTTMTTYGGLYVRETLDAATLAGSIRTIRLANFFNFTFTDLAILTNSSGIARIFAVLETYSGSAEVYVSGIYEYYRTTYGNLTGGWAETLILGSSDISHLSAATVAFKTESVQSLIFKRNSVASPPVTTVYMAEAVASTTSFPLTLDDSGGYCGIIADIELDGLTDVLVVSSVTNDIYAFISSCGGMSKYDFAVAACEVNCDRGTCVNAVCVCESEYFGKDCDNHKPDLSSTSATAVTVCIVVGGCLLLAGAVILYGRLTGSARLTKTKKGRIYDAL